MLYPAELRARIGGVLIEVTLEERKPVAHSFPQAYRTAMRRTLIFAVIALAGCTQTTTRYPSLLPRAIEKQPLAEPTPSVVEATPDPALDAQIAAIGARLREESMRFATAAQDAEAKVAVARGVAEGSESWLDAQAALATLGAMRGPSAAALSELEELALNRGVSGAPAYPALDAAVEAARAQVDAQEQRIATLEGSLATR
jgi:hypothetical protein